MTNCSQLSATSETLSYSKIIRGHKYKDKDNDKDKYKDKDIDKGDR